MTKARATNPLPAACPPGFVPHAHLVAIDLAPADRRRPFQVEAHFGPDLEPCEEWRSRRADLIRHGFPGVRLPIMPPKAKTTGGRKLKEYLRKARTAQARSKQVDVGFFSESRYPTGEKLPVALVAGWLEFGTESRPEVPFFRNAIADAPRDILPILRAGIDPKTMVLDERTAGLVGDAVKARMKQNIVDAKLIDTRLMLDSVDRRIGDADSE